MSLEQKCLGHLMENHSSPKIPPRPLVPLASMWICIVGVKNGFSDPTKVKIGRDWPRKDVGCERQGKALEEGCREREAARKSVSSTEKINTKENLARATAKPRAGCRQSLQDVSVGF